MAVSQVNLDDYSVYSQLSDEELLQIAVERRLSDNHSQPPPPEHIPNCANPLTGLSNFPYRAFRRQFSPLQSLIRNGDVEALMYLVGRRSSSLTEPNDEGWIALHEAAYYGQLQCASILITAHPDSVNRCSLKNETALLLAVGQGNVSCVDILLKHGADPNIGNEARETPLFVACEQPNEVIVDLLLRVGAQVNRSSIQGLSALHEACRNGQLKLCTMLLESRANLQTKNIYGIQPLFTAAQHGYADIIHLLAKKGADVNGQAADGASPLFEACKNGHVSAVEVLLSLKADVNCSMKSGLLPLHVAVQNNHLRIVSMLIPVTSRVRVWHSGISPLHIAAERNREEIMDLLIKSGFDVNTKLSEDCSMMYEDRRSTALYFSVYNMNLEATEMLLEAGADPNLDVFNPLLIAVRLGRMDMATLLLRYGANINAQISTQPSSFPAAVLLRMESLPMLKLLLDNGCDARLCFDCPYGQKPHPALPLSRHPFEEMQFCEAVSCFTPCRLAGPIISVLLDYVCHIRLCSRLLEVLESHSDWVPIKLKAFPPHPLMRLCRLEIRRLLSVRRLKLLHTLPLPVRLVRFLRYDVPAQSPEVTCKCDM
ncbi:ankyrin repeat and SOCS box protein 2-like [Cottoperca gobio]|uniref:Ankyrin repeat and SOCS box protein 2-like n=1 Tax=Cottoperca gobio TaxID=56716 RepID=A0A6J2P9Z8_COTGO|nr:ankyrin repeat and SOCS box protein 2-like [Cottoperca gobio]XP_029282178.1 ankyrin repeat and SOCS box protein 2-like [Cottoperca gobio]XP_029282179.1 ankyrin repeat and SOCS box protein 2-like [Cottoperca gobio]